MNILRGTKLETVKSESQAKFVQERILATEQRLSSLCSIFGAYLQKNCRLRDAGDDLASTLFKFGTDETVNRTLKCSLLKFAEYLAVIGDLRENEIVCLEQNVIKEFLQYNTLCRNAKAEVKSIFSAKENELSRRRNLGKIRQRNPHNRKAITKAECDLVKATAESSQVQRALEEHMEIFERKKIVDIKSILMEFVKGELRYHAESIQIYTEAYKTLLEINVDSDYQAFEELLKQSPVVSRLEIVQMTMESKNNIISPSKSQPSITSQETSINQTSHTLQDEESFEQEYTSEGSSDENETKTELSQINKENYN